MDDLRSGLRRGANLDDVKNVVRMNGSEMQGKAQRYAPVDTGNLKRIITYKPLDGGFTARVASEAEYAAYQEYGTRFQTGTPHIRPSFHEQVSQFKKDLNRLMK